jgi:hypothetical protein
MRPHPRVAWQVVDGQAVLMDLERGQALGLNETGSHLWPRLEGRTEGQLAEELAGAFTVEVERAREDVASFIDLLRHRGFIEG